MILADKIIFLRKKCGWSQEELAERMNVSRQSISKWEGAQSVPDLDKILKLCKVFGVSTDYLLKDEIEEPELKEDVYEPIDKKHVSAEYANEFMEQKRNSSLRIAIGACLCVLSPIPLLTMSALAESGKIADNVGVAIGLGILMCLVLVAVIIFVFNGSIMEDYEWLQKEEFVLDYGVAGIVEDRKKRQKSMLTLTRAIGVGLCILGATILVVISLLNINAVSVLYAVNILLVFVAIAVFLFVRWGNESDSYAQLLQKDDYDVKKKVESPKMQLVGGVYWGCVLTAYLAVSFITFAWNSTWIIWPVAAVFFVVIRHIIQYCDNKDNDRI